MSDQPNVSERIETLLTEYALAVVYSATNDGLGSKEVGQTRRALLSAVAEIEQRAGEIDFFAGIIREHYANIVMPEVEDRDAAKSSDWVNCAIMELGNQHKQAEKWKAVALAHVALMQSLRGSVDEINAASKKTVDACKALGDEWDEAVR